MEITYVPNPQAADGRPVVTTTIIIQTGTNAGNVVGVFTPVKLSVDVSGFDPVTTTGFLANSNDMSTFGRLLGLADNDGGGGTVGQTIFAYVSGQVVDSSWNWTPGGPVFLLGTALSQQLPTSGYLQQIGVAIDAVTLELRIQQAIQL